MAMIFEELDDSTRNSMLLEFEAEQSAPNPYRGKTLSVIGRREFAHLLRDALRRGSEVTLATALAIPDFWLLMEPYVRNGVTRQRRINIDQSAERLSITEFNTWYVRGFTKRLLTEHIERCEVYRAGMPKWEPADCSMHENQTYLAKDIYEAHRARYWPEPGNPLVTSIPFGPGCHHSIKRVTR